MHPVLVDWGFIKIYSWGALLAVALVIIGWRLSARFAREGYNPEMVLDLIIVIALSGIIGARLLYVFAYDWDYTSHHLLHIFDIQQGGLVWYGAFIGGLAAAIIYFRVKRLDFWKMADMLSLYVPLGYAIVRIGCFLNGCCYGKVAPPHWGVVFPDVDALPRYPTQLYSSAINLVIFAVLLYLYPRRTFKGEIFVAYLALYSVYRFIIEFWRENLLIGPVLTISQWISLAVFVGSALVYAYLKRQSRTE